MLPLVPERRNRLGPEPAPVLETSGYRLRAGRVEMNNDGIKQVTLKYPHKIDIELVTTQYLVRTLILNYPIVSQ